MEDNSEQVGVAEAATVEQETKESDSPSTEREQKDPVVALTEDLQRLQAEYSNYRKRVERDRTLAAEIAISGVFAEMLSLLDDLDRARDHGELTGGFKAVADQLVAMTTKLGLEKYGDTPSSFDPSIHEALMHENSADVKETTVTRILQPGYRYKERILRPARVVVTDPE